MKKHFENIMFLVVLLIGYFAIFDFSKIAVF